MLFKIVNPSDPYTIEAPSLEVAVMASVLLGNGQYKFESLDGGEDVPFFMFGGADEWCLSHFKESAMELANRVMDTKLSEVADCLDTVLFGDAQDRIDFMDSTKDMNRPTFEAARMIRQDASRSSMNDIGERAYRMATSLRQSIEDGVKMVQ